MFGDLPPSSMRAGDQVLGRVLHDLPAGRGLAGEGDLGDARAGGERRADLRAVAVHHVQHARRQDVADQVHQHREAQRRVGGRLDHHAVAAGQRRRHLPRRHQQREVPRDDLADDAHRLPEVIGDGVVVDFAERAFLGADAAGEVAEMIGGQRHVGVAASRGSACRCRASRHRRAVRDFSSIRSAILFSRRARSAGEVRAHVPGRMRGVERAFDVVGVGTRRRRTACCRRSGCCR